MDTASTHVNGRWNFAGIHVVPAIQKASRTFFTAPIFPGLLKNRGLNITVGIDQDFESKCNGKE
jgi:hypothetical protein